MHTINWRREGLFLCIIGMETCWIVGWSRVLLRRSKGNVTGLAWWSVLALFLIALATARTLGRLRLQRESWIIGALALLTSLALVQINLGWVSEILRHPSATASARKFVTLLLGLLVWFRALPIPAHSADTSNVTRRFQAGVLILAGLVLVTTRFPVPANDLVLTYFVLGPLAVALTRMEQVAQAKGSGAAPFGRRWGGTLAAMLAVGGVLVALATRTMTVETVRLLLWPLLILVQIFVFVLAMLIAALAALMMPLLQRLLSGSLAEALQALVQDMRRFSENVGPDTEVESTARPGFLDALEVILALGLLLMALWLLSYAFRRWRARHSATPEGVREKVAADATLAQDLAAFLRDQWRRLQEAADLRRLLQRLGVGSARAIYANLLATLANAGHPRQPEQTPYEYQPVADEALPAHQAEVQAITEAFVRARYGEVEAEADELTCLQRAWKRIKSEL